jgi:hypothetical protein
MQRCRMQGERSAEEWGDDMYKYIYIYLSHLLHPTASSTSEHTIYYREHHFHPAKSTKKRQRSSLYKKEINDLDLAITAQPQGSDTQRVRKKERRTEKEKKSSHHGLCSRTTTRLPPRSLQTAQPLGRGHGLPALPRRDELWRSVEGVHGRVYQGDGVCHSGRVSLHGYVLIMLSCAMLCCVVLCCASPSGNLLLFVVRMGTVWG